MVLVRVARKGVQKPRSSALVMWIHSGVRYPWRCLEDYPRGSLADGSFRGLVKRGGYFVLQSMTIARPLQLTVPAQEVGGAVWFRFLKPRAPLDS